MFDFVCFLPWRLCLYLIFMHAVSRKTYVCHLMHAARRGRFSFIFKFVDACSKLPVCLILYAFCLDVYVCIWFLCMRSAVRLMYVIWCMRPVAVASHSFLNLLMHVANCLDVCIWCMRPVAAASHSFLNLLMHVASCLYVWFCMLFALTFMSVFDFYACGQP